LAVGAGHGALTIGDWPTGDAKAQKIECASHRHTNDEGQKKTKRIIFARTESRSRSPIPDLTDNVGNPLVIFGRREKKTYDESTPRMSVCMAHSVTYNTYFT
jgi:hypothetical protein